MRPNYLAIGFALSSVALGAACAFMRVRGWALDFPLDFLLAASSIAPCMLSLGTLGLFGYELARKGEGTTAARAQRGAPWLVAFAGLALASWGLSGATSSTNVFDDRPNTVSALPSGPAILAFVDGAPVDVIDVERGAVFVYAPGASMQADGGASGAWADLAAHRVIARTYRYTSGPELAYVAFEPETGARTELFAVPERDPCSEGCALVGDHLACARRTAIASDASTGWRMELCEHDLAAGPPRVSTWSEPTIESGAAAVLPAGGVLFSDRCEGEGYGDHCLYRAAADGSARQRLGRLSGNACSIVISPDGARAAVAARTDWYGDPCERLFVLDVASGALREIARFAPAPEDEGHSQHGIALVVFSPDGARLAVTSDEVYGCGGYEGVSECEEQLSVLAVDGSGRHHVSERILGANALAWIQ
jgi:hypothetical protein